MKPARAISVAAAIGLLAVESIFGGDDFQAASSGESFTFSTLGFAGRKPISQTLTRNCKVR